MLQFDWPRVWDHDVVRSIASALEATIRTALSKTPSDLIRGNVVVEELTFGSIPPVVALSSMRELSPAHTAVVISVKYAGDASIALKGLQLNLDTTTSVNDKGEDANHAVPFFCPFVMSLVNVVIEGNILLEVCVASEPQLQPPNVGGKTSGRVSVGRLLPTHVLNATTVRGHGGDSTSRAGSSRAVSPTSTLMGAPSFEAKLNAQPQHGSDAPLARRSIRQSGVGLLFGAGGRRGMRHPDAPVSEFSSPARYGGGAGASQGPLGVDGSSFASDASWQPQHQHQPFVADYVSASSSSPPQFLLGDLAQQRVRITKKTILLQLFGDPIKQFQVESNFAPVQGANEKIAAQLRNLLAPAIERLKTEGLTIHL